MSGISWISSKKNQNKNDLKKLLPKEKQKTKKRIENFKLFFGILLTNISLFLILQPDNIDHTLTKVTPIDHPGFKKIILPIIMYTPIYPDKVENPIALFDKNNNLILKMAYLHYPVENGQDISTNNSSNPFSISTVNSNSSNIVRYVVEIPEKDINKILGNKDYFQAFPPPNSNLKYNSKSPLVKTTKGLQYEIIF